MPVQFNLNIRTKQTKQHKINNMEKEKTSLLFILCLLIIIPFLALAIAAFTHAARIELNGSKLLDGFLFALTIFFNAIAIIVFDLGLFLIFKKFFLFELG